MSDPVMLSDETLSATMQTQLQQVRHHPFLFQLLLKQWQRISKRLAYFYQHLASLPRRNRRALQRALATSLVGAAILLALSGAPTVRAAAPINVDGVVCTLDDAIQSANTDTAVGGCTTGSAGADTLNLTADITLPATPSNVSTPMTIQGNGFFISGANSFQVLRVVPGGDLTVDHTIIKDGANFAGGGIGNYQGKLTVQNHSVITGNQAYIGGGIGNYYGKTYVADSTISNNQAYFGGGIENYGGYAATNDTAYLKVERSTFSGNSAYIGGAVDASKDPTRSGYHTEKIYDSTITGSTDGGGVNSSYSYAPGGLLLKNTTISENFSNGYGGGVNCQYNYNVVITETAITNNKSQYDAGGFDSDRCSADILSSTLSGNYSYHGGAGGIDNDGSTLFLINSTISDNHSYERYGGIGNYAAFLSVIGSTITGNSTLNGDGGGIKAYGGDYGSTVYLHHSIVSGNSAGGNGNEIYSDTVTGPNRPSRKHAEVLARREQQEKTRQTRMDKRLAQAQSRAMAKPTQSKRRIATASAKANARRTWRAKHAAQLPHAPTAGTAVHLNSFNLIGHSGETTAQALFNVTPGTGVGETDITATSNGTQPTALNAIFSALGSNGGIVTGDPNTGTTTIQTHALVLGSPAIDKTPNIDCDVNSDLLGVDERGAGFPRNVFINGSDPNNLCDIGAYELQSTHVTAVDIAGLHASINKRNNPVIRWRTITESKIAGFDMYRQTGKGAWTQVNTNFRQAKHSGDVLGTKYRFADKTAKAGKTYRYKVQVKYLDGHTEWTQTVRITKP